MTSKIIQISTGSPDTNKVYVYALCEDGSVWRKFGTSDTWEAIAEPTKKDKPSDYTGDADYA